MIYLVHGDDYAKSRKLIINQQRKLALGLKVEKDISEMSARELYETGCSFDIFGNPPFIVLTIPNTKVAESEEYIMVLKKIPQATTIILLCDRELGRINAFFKGAPELRARVVLNTQPQTSNVFRLVDSVFLQNKSSAYEELEKLSNEDVDAFYILAMLLYGLRNIAHAKFKTAEFSKKSSFIKDKAFVQAQNFTVQNIRELFNFMYATDKKMKTGQINQDIALVYTIEKILGYKQ